jgi:hypothetical protein
MTPSISAELRGQILALGAQKFSSFMIYKELERQNFSVSKSTVSLVLKNHNNGDGDSAVSGSMGKKKRCPYIRTSGVIKKVRNFIAPDNLPT